MNVNKININQSEPTYYIASDAYDITYEDSNVGKKLEKLNTIEEGAQVNHTLVWDGDNSDLDVSDENGNVIARFKDGDIQTKNFNSRMATNQEEGDTEADLCMSDQDGNVILELKGGHIRTKNFDSRIGVAEVVKSDDGRNILILGKGEVI